MSKAKSVIRHRQSWSGKLFPVHIVVALPVRPDRWPLDEFGYRLDYHSGVLEILDSNNRAVKTYNPSRWIDITYEWLDHGTWRTTNKLELVEVDDADQS